MTRKPFTPEARAKMSARAKAAWADPVKRAARVAGMIAHWDDPLTCALHRVALRGNGQAARLKALWADPQQRAAQCARLRAGWRRRRAYNDDE